MKKANISYLKNNLSRVVQCVREGEAVTVMDRNRPVAVLQPVTEPCGPDSEWMLELVRRGAAGMPSERLDPRRFHRMPKPDWEKGPTLRDALADDREDRA